MIVNFLNWLAQQPLEDPYWRNSEIFRILATWQELNILYLSLPEEFRNSQRQYILCELIEAMLCELSRNDY